MTQFTATVTHSSIASAREINIVGTLAEACAAASAEFDGEQRDYVIKVFDTTTGRAPEMVALRKVSSRKWRFVDWH